MSTRILIVDDDPNNIFALRLTLKARKYELESCMMADEAIRILKEDKDFCVVLMDMMMPEIDGYEAIKIIRNTPEISKIPIIAVTAQAMDEDRQKCLEAGAQDYIKKPIDVDLLLTAIQKTLLMLEPSIVKENEIEHLIKDIYESYGYDFSLYSRASFTRRINRICMMDRFTSYAELRYQVLNEPDYFKHFIEQITVNVTEMFRDPMFFKSLREKILPQLGTFPLIRIWVAGCSTGEEAYSIAILLKEAGLYHKCLIYGTDINPSVLETARAGVFPMYQMKTYSENYMLSGGKKDFSDYYTANYDNARFDKALQEKLILSTHNLVSDSSFNSFQLVICRNVLIYFDKELQERVFDLFDASLENLGYLALGSKETLRFSNLNKFYHQVDDQKIWKK